MKFKIHMLNKSFKQKPSRKEIPTISNQITSSISELTIKEFSLKVGEQGRPFTPAIFSGTRKSDNFISQQLFALDFDSGLSLEEFLQRADNYELQPAVVYATYSYTAKHPKYRAVYINDCVVDNISAANILTKLLLEIYPEADQSCKDVSRLYFGGKKVLHYNPDATINILDVSVAFSAYIKDKDAHNYARVLRTFAKNNKISFHKSFLRILKICEDDDKLRNFMHTPNYVLVNTQISSINACFYFIESSSSHTDTPSVYEKNECHISMIRGKSLAELRSLCPLLNDHYKQDLQHDLKFLLATNLVYIINGKEYFLNGLKDHKSKWKEHFNYIKQNKYQPQKCSNGHCPYCKRCNCNRMLDKITKKYRKIEEEKFVELETASEELKVALLTAIQQQDQSIHLIKAQTALGKTTAYCNLAQCHYGKKFMIVVPTLKLQKQIETELNKRNVPVFVTPNIYETLDNLDLSGTKPILESLYKKGYGKFVRQFLKKMIDADTTLDFAQIEGIKKYLSYKENLDGSTCVVTTHALFLTLDDELLHHYEVIIDEDILMTVFKNTATISFHDLELCLAKNLIPSGSRAKIYQLMNLPNGATGTSDFPSLTFDEMATIYSKNPHIQSSLIDFLSSDTYYVDQINKQIIYFKHHDLPVQKMIVVSATLNHQLYKDYCKGRKITYTSISTVKYTGKLLQYNHYSMSRDCIKRITAEKVLNNIHRITENENIGIITFKMMDESKEIYFGKAEGFNDFEGKDLAIIGTPHNIPAVYKLIGAFLGYNATETLCRRQVCHSGYEFTIMTFESPQMQNLQFYFLYSELEQAIGRARLLRHNCTVYLFSNLLCRQAEIIEEDYIKN